MGRGPEAKALAGDSRLPESPPSRLNRGHPVSSREALLGSEFLSGPSAACPGGRGCLRDYLDLERWRLREENAVADGRGAWNPS